MDNEYVKIGFANLCAALASRGRARLRSTLVVSTDPVSICIVEGDTEDELVGNAFRRVAQIVGDPPTERRLRTRHRASVAAAIRAHGGDDQLPYIEVSGSKLQTRAVVLPVAVLKAIRELILAEDGAKVAHRTAAFARRHYSGPIAETVAWGGALLVTFGNVDLPPMGCCACKKRGRPRVCGRCRSRWYCSRACQKRDWPNHRGECPARAAIRADVKGEFGGAKNKRGT
jgi:hypothetical protein